ncbi:hypothetical protein [Candidatus Accumulibacter phosphatis]|uniref:Lipoprotein n=1 Tax=Candidatus Accumulibacter phosphatis TaxID=327160 RepID=A0A5S4EII2_9PROT|nr:hypothetical protein [Candidatus Accumulibacter phosphatis]TMQ75132.1 hypothetical protein ACCUM_1947 [Candidatus Accumulibacter phosphatis]
MSARSLLALALALGVCLSGCFSPNAAREADIAARRSRLQTAEAMFQERCKKAGVTIHRTAENVEGVFLMKLRPDKINFGEQFTLDDPYGSDLDGDGYIVSFLRGSYQANTRSTPVPGSPPRLGYLYVEAVDPKDGKRYRYTGRIEEPWQFDKSYLKGYKRFVMERIDAPGPAPRYGITYDDISTREEREYWIAGSSLRVIDLKTQEVMAERIGYMMDRAQGSGAGGRSPWLFAADHACPSFGTRHSFTRQARQTQDFVENVLKPKLEK